jgi:hypothetical protein
MPLDGLGSLHNMEPNQFWPASNALLLFRLHGLLQPISCLRTIDM